MARFLGWPQLEAITIALAAVMIFNNLFGFTGISLFARYLVTPVLAIWCAYLVARGFAAGAASRHAVTGPHAGHLGYWVAVAAVIGFAMWGNEGDVWRYGRPRILWPLPTWIAPASLEALSCRMRLTYHSFLLCVVVSLVFFRGNVLAGGVQALGVIPVNPFQGREHDVIGPAPRPFPLDELFLVKAVQ